MKYCQWISTAFESPFKTLAKHSCVLICRTFTAQKSVTRLYSDCCQTAAERGEAELRIPNFETTWSEYQKASQTVAERGEAELRILDFKTTWSEFQKPGQTAAERDEAEPRILNFKTTWSEF